MEDRAKSKAAGALVAVLGGAGLYVASKSLFTGFFSYWLFLVTAFLCLVDAGHRAIMFNRIGGIGNEVYREGMHARLPWFQYPIVYDIRARPNQIRSPTGSKDLQMVNIGLRVLSRPGFLLQSIFV